MERPSESGEMSPALDLVDQGLPRLQGVLEQIRCIRFAASQEFCTPSAIADMLGNVADELQSVVSLLERWRELA
jgi:hypothetical protein